MECMKSLYTAVVVAVQKAETAFSMAPEGGAEAALVPAEAVGL